MLDAVAEMTNMIIGSVKTDLEERTRPARPEHPDGGIRPQFQDPKRRDSEWIRCASFGTKMPLLIKLCLAPSEQAPCRRIMGIATCALEV